MTNGANPREGEPVDRTADDAANAGWAEALQAQFGSVPWWVTSATVHVIVLLLLGLIVVSEPRDDTSDVIIPIGDFAETPPEEEPEPPERKLFRRDREIDMPDDEVQHPVFVHEPVEDRTHMETEQNMDDDTARGEEDAISDIPMGGEGVVGDLGVGGGPAGCFGFRSGGGRRRAALRGCGGIRAITGADLALAWLARNQEPAGNWAIEKWGGSMSEECTVGVTGLGLLAFLGSGHTEKAGSYKETVRRAVAYLVGRQDRRGMIGANSGWKVGGGYNHAIAGLALAEAYGMAGVPRTGIAAQKAVGYSVGHHQSEYSAWRYGARVPPDTSVTGWFIMQIKSATVAGLRVDGRGFQGAIAWLDKVTDMPNEATGEYGGKARYQPGREPTPCMTSVAMLGRQFMGWKRSHPLLLGGADYLAQHLPKWGGNGHEFYYWYYGTLVMFQMGGDWWRQWNASMRDMLLDHQVRSRDPALDGSWEPFDKDGGRAGRAYSTAMGCLCLEVYYRYLPLYQEGN